MDMNWMQPQQAILQAPPTYSASLQQPLPPQQSTIIIDDNQQQKDEEVEIGFFDIIDIKYYIKAMIILLIIYFILSLDPVKNTIGKILTPINLLPDGTISYLGYFLYGLLLSLIFGFIMITLEYIQG